MSIFNRYGQPNGSYNQPASRAVTNVTQRRVSSDPQTQNPVLAALNPEPSAGTGVQRNGSVDLSAPPPAVTGNYDNGTRFRTADALRIYNNAAQTYRGNNITPDEMTSLFRDDDSFLNRRRYVDTDQMNAMLQGLYASPEAVTYRTPTDPTPAPAGPSVELSMARGGPIAATGPLGAVSSTAMPGWEQTKWADPNKQSLKYVAGRYMTQLGAPSEANMARLADYLRSQGHDVAYTGGDKMSIDGGGLIDMIQDSDGNPKWWWGAYGAPTEADYANGHAQRGAVQSALTSNGSDALPYSRQLLQSILQALGQ